MFWTALIVILILLLLGALPAWKHSLDWGLAPSGSLAAILLIVVVLVSTGWI